MKKGDLKEWQSLQQLLFSFQGKIDISIHFSVTSPKILLAIRIVAFLLLSFRYYYELVNIHSYFMTFQFLTELGFHLTWIYFSSVLLDYLLNQLPSNKISKRLSDWVNLLFQVVWCIQFVVTIIFWIILYDPNFEQTSKDKDIKARQMLLNIGVHGFPLLCLILDFALNVYQFPKKHLFVVVFIGLSYMFINMGYSLAIRPVYDPIDWVSFMSYVYLVICALLIVLIHLISRVIWLKVKKPRIQKDIKQNTSQMLSIKDQLID